MTKYAFVAILLFVSIIALVLHIFVSQTLGEVAETLNAFNIARSQS